LAIRSNRFKATIGAKVLVLSATLLGLNMALGISALLCVRSLETDSRTLSGTIVPAIYTAGRINTGAKAILLRIHRHLSSSSLAGMDKFEAYLNDRNASVRKEAQAYGSLALSAKENDLVARILADLDRVADAWQRVRPLSRAMRKREAVDLFDKQGIAASEDLDNAAKDLVAISKVNGYALDRKAEADARAARAWFWAVLAVSVICGVVLTLLLVRGVERSLRRTVEEVSGGVRHVLDAASQISGCSDSLALHAADQAASLEETSACSTEIATTAALNARNCLLACDLVEQSESRFAETESSVREMGAAIGEIDQASNRISRIIQVIDAIAFQTNLLALNAAVEAARAGQAGAGFAVVADEVRNLAQRSAQAARDTSALIEESIATSTGGNEKMQKVIASVHGAADASAKIRELVQRVNAGSQEQARGIEEVAKAVAEMERLTHTTAASARDSHAAAGRLGTQATALEGTVARLAEMVEATKR
jgi:methyl-accepting chemotaxis protein/methyl-accepting chemotaxis protein-1 (serine sensor receptor)